MWGDPLFKRRLDNDKETMSNWNHDWDCLAWRLFVKILQTFKTLPCGKEKECSLYRFSWMSGFKLLKKFESVKGVSLLAKLYSKLPCDWKCRRSYMSISVFKSLTSSICNNSLGIKLYMVYNLK